MSDKTLNSVKCDVSNCVHNVEGRECSANSITVCSSCSCADCSDDTLCKTFKARDR